MGVLMLVVNVRDEIRGTTTISSPGRTGAGLFKESVSKSGSDAGSKFRGAMTYHWVAGIGLTAASSFALALQCHYDRHDLLHPSFDSDGEESKAE